MVCVWLKLIDLERKRTSAVGAMGRGCGCPCAERVAVSGGHWGWSSPRPTSQFWGARDRRYVSEAELP